MVLTGFFVTGVSISPLAFMAKANVGHVSSKTQKTPYQNKSKNEMVKIYQKLIQRGLWEKQEEICKIRKLDGGH